MQPAELEPTISISMRPQTHALDRAATGDGHIFIYLLLSVKLRVQIHRHVFSLVNNSPALHAQEFGIFVIRIRLYLCLSAFGVFVSVSVCPLISNFKTCLNAVRFQPVHYTAHHRE
jgi:hypothetical protein